MRDWMQVSVLGTVLFTLVKPFLLAAIGGAVAVLAFPPFNLAPLVVAGIGLFLMAIRATSSSWGGFWAGLIYGIVFWGGLMWWLGLLHLATLALIPLQALLTGLLGAVLAKTRQVSGAQWVIYVAAAWTIMETVRYRFPFGGIEWGAAGYAMPWLGPIAPLVGTSGITVLVVALAAAMVLESDRSATSASRLLGVVPIVALLVISLAVPHRDAEPVPVAIVQGAGPCPFDSCPPDQRLRTMEKHLELTATIPAGSVDLVVWPESSAGSTNADPVLNPDVAAAIGAEAVRIGAWIMVGTDRPLSDTEWVNANVVFNREGVIVGEYRKQLPVPFGEWIPMRALFTRLIPELSRVPRDMVPGDGPVLFEVDSGSERFTLGSVISWEGGFSRFAREHAKGGAMVMVVATNNESYGPSAPTADQFMGMTRMRAAELGLPLIHAAVTGKSVVIDSNGEPLIEPSGLGESRVLYSEVVPQQASVYAQTGDLVMVLAVLAGGLVWLRRRQLVGSTLPAFEEE